MARHMNMGNCMVRKFTNVDIVNRNIQLLSLSINRLYPSYVQSNIEIILDIDLQRMTILIAFMFSVNIEDKERR